MIPPCIPLLRGPEKTFLVIRLIHVPNGDPKTLVNVRYAPTGDPSPLKYEIITAGGLTALTTGKARR